LGHSSFAEHRRGCLLPGTFLDAGLEKVDDFDDAFGAMVWSTLGGVDPAEVGAAVELGQPVEERSGVGFGRERCGDVLGKVVALGPSG
jgi:hypothetical protein